jgi:hypothetical protein
MVSQSVFSILRSKTLTSCSLNNVTGDGAEKFYRAARFYNSGAVDSSGDLGKGCCTHCYGKVFARDISKDVY